MRNKILVVDDMDMNRDLLADILEDEYSVIAADNGCEALKVVRENKDEIAAILLDLVMPGMSGFEVLHELKNSGYMTDIPVLVISTDESLSSEKECFEAGVSDFIHKPFDEKLVRTRVNNIVDLYLYKQHLEETVAEQTKQLNERNINIIDFIGSVVETRDLESGEHIQRVKEYTKVLATSVASLYPEYSLSEHDISVITQASALHDVGKIAIPDSILLKPGKLTPEEYEKMKEHSARGAELIEGSKGMWDEEYSKVTYDICRYHHERYDGKGYPDGLVGEEIPISAQIVSLADVYDALISERCYKDSFSKRQAFDMIVGGECGMFSPKILTCFIEKADVLEEIADRIV
ncbi:MAG: response regulator [Lachnospiraceae bacterium]|nr:response regulator [Candidatus Colinaster equi]